jgi:metallopeptidase MepB
MERKSPSAALGHGFRNPPQAPATFTATSKSIIADAKKLVERWCHAEDDIVQTVLPDTATFANVLLPLVQLENATALQVNILELYQDVSTDAEMRDASREAQELIDTAKNRTAIREDLFHLVDAVLKREGDLDPESQLYLEREHRRFIGRGAKLAARLQKSRFEHIQNRLNQLRGQFRKNISDENGGIWFALEELEGVPNDLISKLEKGENEHRGKLMLKLADQEHHSVLSFAQKVDTRQRFYIARENRTSQNRPLLKECLVLRDEAARILGYPNHAAYRLENMMAKDPETVNTFLDDMQSGLLAAGQQALGRLKQLKNADVESQGGVYDGRFFLWDQDFYHRKMLTTHFSVDKLKIAEYFPIQTTVMGMLRIFERLFGLVFTEFPSEERTVEMLWHEDVQLFSVWNEVELGGGFVGYLYLDLLHRDGKDGSAFNYTIQPVGMSDLRNSSPGFDSI